MFSSGKAKFSENIGPLLRFGCQESPDENTYRVADILNSLGFPFIETYWECSLSVLPGQACNLQNIKTKFILFG